MSSADEVEDASPPRKGCCGCTEQAWCFLKCGCCCFVFSSFTLIVLIFIAISDLLMLIVSVMAYRQYLHFWDIVPNKVRSITILFITVASIRLFISWCCSGVQKKKDEEVTSAEGQEEGGKRKPEEKRSLLARLIGFIGGAIFVAQLVGGIMALSHRKQLEPIKVALTAEFNNASIHTTSYDLIQQIQKYEKCCGISGPNDYEFHSWSIAMKSNSCCESPPCSVNLYFPAGCAEAIDKHVHYYNTYLAVLGIGVPIIAFVLPAALLVWALCAIKCMADTTDWNRCAQENAVPLIKEAFGTDFNLTDKKPSNSPGSQGTELVPLQNSAKNQPANV